MKQYPRCPSCGKVFVPGDFWANANSCRGLLILNAITQEGDGLSAYDLSLITGLTTQETSSGLAKLRERDVISGVPEERDSGGIRYRHFMYPDHADRVRRFAETLKAAEASLLDKEQRDRQWQLRQSKQGGNAARG